MRKIAFHSLVNGIALATCCTFAACGPKEETKTETTKQTQGVAVAQEKNIKDLGAGLKYEQIKAPAEGAKVPVAGKPVSVHYKGCLVDGTKFDSSYDRNEPITFVLGVGQVIRGWDIGIAQMKVGEKGVLTIPADLAYGNRGAGRIIPPGATLVFDVELVSVG